MDLADIRDVANWFIHADDQQERSITRLKLQRLCYYAQGYCLALLNRPMFNPVIDAKTHGVAIWCLDRQYRCFGGCTIPPISNRQHELSEEEIDILKTVWEKYGKFSAWYLREDICKWYPWKHAMENNTIVISLKDIKRFFSDELGGSQKEDDHNI